MKIHFFEETFYGVMATAFSYVALLKLRWFDLTAQIADPGGKMVSEFGSLGIVAFVVYFTLTNLNKQLKENTEAVKALPQQIAKLIHPKQDDDAK